MGTDNTNKDKATSKICEVKSRYYDPVVINDVYEPGNQITQKDGLIRMETSGNETKFTGYFGYGRWNGETIMVHDGYDYIAEVEKTDVIAVHHGYLTKIRLGHNDGSKCALKDFFFNTGLLSFKKQYNNNESLCKYCDNKKHCYGFQVFLEIEGTNYTAYYAHLSEIDNSIVKKISNFEFDDTNNTLTFSPAIELCGGDTIGKSGDTGNASAVSDKHLHFECRLTNTETKVSPNRIVNTEFKIKYAQYNKIPYKYKGRVNEYIEEIKKEDIIEYRATNKWNMGEYLKMRKEEEKKQNPKLTDDDFDKNIKPNIISKLKKNKWDAWFEYKNNMIKLESGSEHWPNIRKEMASKKALNKFREEHILVVSKIKEKDADTQRLS